MLAEIAADNAVIVLQNLGLFASRPYWHYAVVIGYDLEKIPFCCIRQQSAPHHVLQSVERLWIDGGRWAMLSTASRANAGERARSAVRGRRRSVEQTGCVAAAHLAYAALLERWPANLPV